MGVEMKPTSFRFDAATLGKIDELLALFSALGAKKRSHVIRIVVDVVHGWFALQGVVFTAGTLQALTGSLQRLLSTTSVGDCSAPELPARLPVAREDSLDVQAGQDPHVLRINQGIRSSDAVRVLAPSRASFLGFRLRRAGSIAS